MNAQPRSYGSYYNHMMEDLLSQRDYREFYNTIFQYAHTDGNMSSFSLCLNEYWKFPEVMMGSNALRVGYTKNMYRVIRSCGDGDGAIDFDDCFDVSRLIPELDADRDRPEAYIFTPLNFDDRCFGYAVVSYGSECRAYDISYSTWIKQIMQGMEAFYRQASLQKLLDKVNASQIRDDLTGVYNYNGFMARCRDMCNDAVAHGRSIELLAIDIKGLGQINASLGRKVGDEAIQALARMISASLEKSDVCMRMCNDEFIVAYQVMGDADDHADAIVKSVESRTREFNRTNGDNLSWRYAMRWTDRWLRMRRLWTTM